MPTKLYGRTVDILGNHRHLVVMRPRLKAALARRASGAAGSHGDRRLRRLRTKAAKKSQVIKEQND